MRSCCGLLLALLLAACSSAGDIPRQTAIIPKGSLRLTPTYAITFADLVQVGLVAGAV